MIREQNDNYRIKIWGVMCFAFMLVFFHRYLIAVIADNLSKEMGLTATHLSNLASMYFYAYALMQIPVGILSDTLGPRKITSMGMLLAGISSVILPLTDSIYIAYISRFLVGIGVSTVLVSILKILSVWFTSKEFTFYYGWTSFLGNLGGLLATSPFALLVLTFGWRFSYYFISVLTCGVALLLWIVVRDYPQSYENPLPAEDSGDLNNLIANMKRVTLKPETWVSFFQLFTVMGIIMSFSGLWGVPYLMHTYGLPKGAAANYVMVFTLGVMIGAPLVGVIENKIGRPKILIKTALGVFSLLWAYLLFVEGLKPGEWQLPIIFFVLGFAGVFIILVYSKINRTFDAQQVGSVMGLLNLAPFLGTPMFNSLVGIIVDYSWTGKMVDGVRIYDISSYRLAFSLYFLFSLLVLLTTLFVKDSREVVVSERE